MCFTLSPIKPAKSLYKMETENNELVEITINFKGIDVAAVVTMEEANILLNDEAAAAQYAEALLADEQTPSPQALMLAEEQTSSSPSLEAAQCPKQATSREATLFFLTLRTKYNDKFNDRKTLKQSLWQKIADEMTKHGYDMPEGREGAEKCRQKFANLQRSYLNYIKHMKTTGEEKKDPPPYFNEMNALLGSKDKVNPPYLEDSLDTSSSHELDEHTASCSSTSSSVVSHEHNSLLTSSNVSSKQKEIKNRFSSSHSSVRPATNFNKIVELFTEQHQQLRQDKEKHMKVLEDAIKVQNEQRAQFLKFLMKSEKRKRRNSSSSSSDE